MVLEGQVVYSINNENWFFYFYVVSVGPSSRGMSYKLALY
jgi:hypothetical protein